MITSQQRAAAREFKNSLMTADKDTFTMDSSNRQQGLVKFARSIGLDPEALINTADELEHAGNMDPKDSVYVHALCLTDDPDASSKTINQRSKAAMDYALPELNSGFDSKDDLLRAQINQANAANDMHAYLVDHDNHMPLEQDQDKQAHLRTYAYNLGLNPDAMIETQLKLDHHLPTFKSELPQLVALDLAQDPVASVNDLRSQQITAHRNAPNHLSTEDQQRLDTYKAQSIDFIDSQSGRKAAKSLVGDINNDDKLNDYAKAIRVDPNNLQFAIETYQQSGQFPKASQPYAKALSLAMNPDQSSSELNGHAKSLIDKQFMSDGNQVRSRQLAQFNQRKYETMRDSYRQYFQDRDSNNVAQDKDYQSHLRQFGNSIKDIDGDQLVNSALNLTSANDIYKQLLQEVGVDKLQPARQTPGFDVNADHLNRPAHALPSASRDNQLTSSVDQSIKSNAEVQSSRQANNSVASKSDKKAPDNDKADDLFK